MSRGSSREANKSKARLRAKLFGITAVFFVVALMIVSLINKGEETDAQGCPKNGGPSREVIVLLDTSDPLSNKHKAEIKRILREMTHPSERGRHDSLAVRKGERLTFYVLTNSDEPKELLRSCNPVGNPVERQERQKIWAGCTQGKVITERRWKQFEDKIFRLFPEFESEVQPRSFIIETIAVIIPEHANSSQVENNTKPVHLIIISDLLQNTDKLSHYRSSYSKPEELVGGEFSTDLSHVTVSLFQLKRQKYAKYQTSKHSSWWTDWVETMGGRVARHQSL